MVVLETLWPQATSVILQQWFLGNVLHILLFSSLYVEEK